MSGPAASGFEALSRELDDRAQTLVKSKQKTGGWKEPLSPDDTANALEQARSYEKSIFRFVQPGFWRLKKLLQARYDFSHHAVAPSWTKILQDLAAQHDAEVGLGELSTRARNEWRVDDADAFRTLVNDLRTSRLTAHPSVQPLVRLLVQSNDAAALIENLCGIEERFAKLDQTLGSILSGHEQFEFAELTKVLSELRGQCSLLAELSPILADLVELPEQLSHALRRADVPLGEFEAAMGHKSLNAVYRQDRAVNRFEGRILVRPSGTEPIVRVLVEARNGDLAKRTCGTIARLVESELG
jgi:hypothetical protein